MTDHLSLNASDLLILNDDAHSQSYFLGLTFVRFLTSLTVILFALVLASAISSYLIDNN